MISCSRSTGSSHQTGSGAIIAEIRLPRAPCSSSARTLTGTIARSSSPSVSWPRARRYLPIAAGDDREDDVVDGAAVGVLDPLEVAEVGLDHLEAAVRADLDVEDGVRGRDIPALTIFEVAPTPLQHLARAAQRGAEAAVDLLRAGQPLLQRFAQQLEVGRLGAGEPRRRLVGRALRLGVEVEEDGGDVDAGDAVDQRVVALADDREAVVGQALDQPQLPERLRAVELLGEDPRREVAQLLVGARRRQRGLAHVVVEVEVRVVDPDRAALVERDEAQLLAEARHQVQARGDVVAELLRGWAPRL